MDYLVKKSIYEYVYVHFADKRKEAIFKGYFHFDRESPRRHNMKCKLRNKIFRRADWLIAFNYFHHPKSTE